MRAKRGKVPLVVRCFAELEKAVVGGRDDLLAGKVIPDSSNLFEFR